MLASADMVKGEKLFKKCASCHTFNKGGENKRPLSARSKYIETMKEMKLTPKPSSIIGKYNESRQTLGFQHVSFGDEQAFAIANSSFMLPDVQTINFNHNN